MTLFERLRNGGSSETATANSAIPANALPELAEISRNSSSSLPTNQQRAGAISARSPVDEASVRTLSDGEKSALAIAERAIARAALTDEQKASRHADLRRDPTFARFWSLVWPDALNSSKGNQ